MITPSVTLFKIYRLLCLVQSLLKSTIKEGLRVAFRVDTIPLMCSHDIPQTLL